MVIDSTIFIEHLRAKDRSMTTLANLTSDSSLYVSTITVYELYAGATNAAKENDVALLLEDIVLLPFTQQTGVKAGEIFRYLRTTGMMIETADILIAATALVHDLPVKTLNKDHFTRIPNLIVI
jgi:tRNA(fMet)-specific endonuclease VapC